MTTDLVARTVERILGLIGDRVYDEGDALPSEAALAAQLEVSRPTMREAVKVLVSRGVLRVVHGRGTFVQPTEVWTDIPTLIEAQARLLPPAELGTKLVEIRSMIEVGAAGLAALNRRPADLARMERLLDDFDDGVLEGDLDKVVRCDLGFHEAVLVATGNPLLPAVLKPIAAHVEAQRRLTSTEPRVRDRSRDYHRAVFVAIRDGDPEMATQRMREHLTQTGQYIAEHMGV